ncbi:MAG: hypothetical protein Q9213_004847 [Squamulea squamosa]
MSPILDLPNELLYRIVSLTPWSDLVPFALSCRAIHVRCKDTLQERLALKKYSALTVGGFDLDESYFTGSDDLMVDSKHNAVLILGNILDEPDVANWSRIIRIGDLCNENEPFFDGHDSDDDYRDEMQLVVERHSIGLEKMVKECVFIPEGDKTDAFESLCKPTGEVVAARLLLTLLPNLHTVAFQSNSYGVTKLLEVVERIAVANRDPNSSHHGKALGQLREITMDRWDTEFGEDPHVYGPFAMLPSVKVIRGFKIDGQYFHWPSSFAAPSSNVTEIDIEHSAVTSGAFRALLGGISALRKFTYHHGGATVGEGLYDPAGIVKALIEHAAASLISLDIDAKDTYMDEEEVQYVGSLQAFRVLKTIRLEEHTFQYRIVIAFENVQALSDGQYHEEEDSQSDDSREDGSWDRLVDILPASIQTFKLVQTPDAKGFKELFEGMTKHKSEKLPALKTIQFEHSKPLDPDILKDLKSAGLKLKSWNNTI